MNIEQMTDAEIDVLQEQYDCFGECDAPRIHDFARAILAARDAQWNALIAGQAGEAVAWTDEAIEALAFKHEAFGFGRVDAKGLTTHGFDPEGLRDFARELLASLPAPQAVQAGPTHTEVYAEGRGDQFKDDCAVIQLLLENCDDADTYGDGQMNTTRIRELLTHFDTALAAAPSPDGKAEQAEAPSAEDAAYENEHPAAKRMRLEFEAKYGSNSALMRAANNWFNVRTQYNEAWNRDREQPVTETDVEEAERAMLATQPTASPEQAEAPSDADPLTPEQEEWVMDLAEKHNLGRRVPQIGAMRGVAPDVFYTDASYRTHELFCFAAALLSTKELT